MDNEMKYYSNYSKPSSSMPYSSRQPLMQQSPPPPSSSHPAYFEDKRMGTSLLESSFRNSNRKPTGGPSKPYHQESFHHSANSYNPSPKKKPLLDHKRSPNYKQQSNFAEHLPSTKSFEMQPPMYRSSLHDNNGESNTAFPPAAAAAVVVPASDSFSSRSFTAELPPAAPASQTKLEKYFTTDEIRRFNDYNRFLVMSSPEQQKKFYSQLTTVEWNRFRDFLEFDSSKKSVTPAAVSAQPPLPPPVDDGFNQGTFSSSYSFYYNETEKLNFEADEILSPRHHHHQSPGAQISPVKSYSRPLSPNATHHPSSSSMFFEDRNSVYQTEFDLNQPLLDTPSYTKTYPSRSPHRYHSQPERKRYPSDRENSSYQSRTKSPKSSSTRPSSTEPAKTRVSLLDSSKVSPRKMALYLKNSIEKTQKLLDLKKKHLDGFQVNSEDSKYQFQKMKKAVRDTQDRVDEMKAKYQAILSKLKNVSPKKSTTTIKSKPKESPKKVVKKNEKSETESIKSSSGSTTKTIVEKPLASEVPSATLDNSKPGPIKNYKIPKKIPVKAPEKTPEEKKPAPVVAKRPTRSPSKTKSSRPKEEVTFTDEELKAIIPKFLWCQVCDLFFDSFTSYLSHMHAKQHISLLRASDYDIIKAAERQKGTDSNVERITDSEFLGNEFLYPTNSFYCDLCSTFINTTRQAESHLLSPGHQQLLKKYSTKNSNYESKLRKERIREFRNSYLYRKLLRNKKFGHEAEPVVDVRRKRLKTDDRSLEEDVASWLNNVINQVVFTLRKSNSANNKIDDSKKNESSKKSGPLKKSEPSNKSEQTTKNESPKKNEPPKKNETPKKSEQLKNKEPPKNESPKKKEIKKPEEPKKENLVSKNVVANNNKICEKTVVIATDLMEKKPVCAKKEGNNKKEDKKEAKDQKEAKNEEKAIKKEEKKKEDISNDEEKKGDEECTKVREEDQSKEELLDSSIQEDSEMNSTNEDAATEDEEEDYVIEDDSFMPRAGQEEQEDEEEEEEEGFDVIDELQ